jgi:hypothetical protein
MSKAIDDATCDITKRLEMKFEELRRESLKRLRETYMGDADGLAGVGRALPPGGG